MLQQEVRRFAWAGTGKPSPSEPIPRASGSLPRASGSLPRASESLPRAPKPVRRPSESVRRASESIPRASESGRRPSKSFPRASDSIRTASESVPKASGLPPGTGARFTRCPWERRHPCRLCPERSAERRQLPQLNPTLRADLGQRRPVGKYRQGLPDREAGQIENESDARKPQRSDLFRRPGKRIAAPPGESGTSRRFCSAKIRRGRSRIFLGGSKLSATVQKLLRRPKASWDRPKLLGTAPSFLDPSQNFFDRQRSSWTGPKLFRTVQKFLEPSEDSWSRSKRFWTAQKVLGPSKSFPDRPRASGAGQKAPGLRENLPDCPRIFSTVEKDLEWISRARDAAACTRFPWERRHPCRLVRSNGGTPATFKKAGPSAQSFGMPAGMPALPGKARMPAIQRSS